MRLWRWPLLLAVLTVTGLCFSLCMENAFGASVGCLLLATPIGVMARRLWTR